MTSNYKSDITRGSRESRVRNFKGNVIRNSRLDITLYF